MDEFQERYLDHQDRKKKLIESGEYGLSNDDRYIRDEEDFSTLYDIMISRRSQRKFNSVKLYDFDYAMIKDAIRYAPSSCNRQSIYVKEVDPIIAEEYLVGGKRWIDKAQKVLLVFASRAAYKNPVEVPYMPYLDAGFACQNVYLVAESLNFGVCFVNPNIRDEHIDVFNQLHNKENDIFCGALAIGNYDKKAVVPPIRKRDEIIK